VANLAPRTDPIDLQLIEPVEHARTDAYRFGRALLLTLALATLDAPGLFRAQTSAWYLLLVPPLLTIVLVRVRRTSTLIRRPIASDVVLGVLFIFGLIGTTYATLFRPTTATARPIFIPMTIAFLYLATLERPTAGECDRLIRALTWIGIGYLLLNAAIYFGLAPGPGLSGDHPFRNSQLFFVAMALVGAGVLRRLGAFVILLGLIGFMVVTYPSATTILVSIGTVSTLYVTQRRASQVRVLALACALVIVIPLALARPTGSIDVSERYFAAVGKADTNPTRVAVWTEGMRRFRESPLIGSGFAGSANAIIVRVPGRRPIQVPFHNDFILFLVAGGVVGVALLLIWVILTEVIVLRRYRMFLRAGWDEHARLLRTLLVGFNAFFVAAAFNPEFTAVSGSASIFVIYGLMLSLGHPPIRGEEDA
jgi:O-antigen ligase